MTFEAIEKFQDKILALIDPNSMLTLVAGFKAVISAWFILYVVFVGYSLVWGKTNTPIRDIVERFILLSVVSVFAFNIGEWYNLAIAAVNGLNTWASGTMGNMFSKLDIMSQSLPSLYQQFITNDQSTLGIESLVDIVIVYIGYYSFGLVASFILIMNNIGLKLLIFTFPLAVVALAFPPVKDIFAKWLQLVVGNAISLLFINLFFTTIYGLVLAEIIRVIRLNGTVNITSVAFELLAYFIAGIFLFKMATSFAESLTAASVERIAASSSKQTAAGVAAASYAGGSLAKKAGSRTAKILDGGGGGTTGKPVGGAIGVGLALSKKGLDLAKSAHNAFRNRNNPKPNGSVAKSNANKNSTPSEYAKYRQINKYRKSKEGEDK